MAKRRVMQAVLDNFLGTFSSRYSDFKGFWIFGLLVENFELLEVDLLDPEISSDTMTAVTASLARKLFAEQARKAGFRLTEISGARVTLARSQGLVQGHIDQTNVLGYSLNFVAQADLINHIYQSKVSVFVQPRKLASQ